MSWLLFATRKSLPFLVFVYTLFVVVVHPRLFFARNNKVYNMQMMDDLNQFLHTEHDDNRLDEASRNLLILIFFVSFLTCIALSVCSLVFVIPTYFVNDGSALEIMQTWWFPCLRMWAHYVFYPFFLYLLICRPLVYVWRRRRARKASFIAEKK